MKAVGPSRRRTICVLVVALAVLGAIWLSSGYFAATGMLEITAGSVWDLSLRYGAVEVTHHGAMTGMKGGLDGHLYIRDGIKTFWYWAPKLVSRPLYLTVTAPLWLLIVPLSLVTIAMVKAERRRPPHACAGCGYDRSEDPDAKCPECGRA